MSKISLLILFTLITFKLSVAKNIEFVNIWIVWDIGQGQWVTHVMADTCAHFDAGGEMGSYKYVDRPLKKNCSGKNNILYLSHWDFDHYFNITSVVKNFSLVCWASRPALNKEGISIQKILDLQIPPCWDAAFDSVQVKSWIPQTGKTSNDFSAVHTSDGFLLPGDSTVKQEKHWAQILKLQSIRVLVLGHHGSRTSTSTDLLQKIPDLKMAVASARLRKYGHPHKETLARLWKNKTPVLKTEDWGSLWFL